MDSIILCDDTLVMKETGEIIGSKTPRFTGLDYNDYVQEYINSKEIRFLEPMTAQELDEAKLQEYVSNNVVIAEQKFDGHRGLVYITSKGNRMFSRRVSKQTDWFAENTDQMPHIRDIKIPSEYYGTVLDGEILLPVDNCTCRQVQSVTGALPETALKHQLEVGFAYLNAFDILYYKGINVQRMPLWKRKVYLWDVLCHIQSPFIQMCQLYATQNTIEHIKELWGSYGVNLGEGILGALQAVEDFDEQFRLFLREGKEGLIIKNVYGIYEQRRSKAFIKMKAHKTYDVVIMGYEEPTKEYSGKELANWKWFSGETPVTKYYFKDWIGAIVFGVWKKFGEYGDLQLVEVGRTSGMDEYTRELISECRDRYLGAVIEVEAQGVINMETGSLQHPRFIQFREDKSSEQCTFEAHIREDT